MTVIAIFDVGKTNKKLLLFDEQYKVVYEESATLPEIKDEDGFACEDVDALTKWVSDTFETISKDDRFIIKALNFSGYGASLVYIGNNGEVIAPLYNYLKPYPQLLQQQFYKANGGESQFAKQTASPVLGSLNSGMQLYRLKMEQPVLFKTLAFALHLPQYLSFIFTRQPATDITSVGCHTNLWNFQNNSYHAWVSRQQMDKIFAPILPCTTVIPFEFKNKKFLCGIGLHDSSAALIPYFAGFKTAFILLSTGTWSISLNPFNHTQLSDYELHQDCLCYLTYQGEKVKASRLFIGYAHEQQVKKMAEHFNKPDNYFTTIAYDKKLLVNILSKKNEPVTASNTAMIAISNFDKTSLNDFITYEQAYHQFIFEIVQQQIKSTKLVLENTTVKQIFVDGGFSKNEIFMHLLAEAFNGIEIFAATVPQASALGAALVIHDKWNSKPLPLNIVETKDYTYKN